MLDNLFNRYADIDTLNMQTFHIIKNWTPAEKEIIFDLIFSMERTITVLG